MKSRRKQAIRVVTKALREGRIAPDEATRFAALYERDPIATRLLIARREAKSTGLFDQSHIAEQPKKQRGTGLFDLD